MNDTNADELAVSELKRLIEEAERIVFFTGAGISTESGIPDFRSPGTGIWNKISPIEFQDFVKSESVRIKSWQQKFNGNQKIEQANPNDGHKAISTLIHDQKATAVITQNIDNLHQKSGIPDDQVIELHGNAGYCKCLDCGKRYELNEIRSEFAECGTVKPCRVCGGIIKTATISFGQSMPIEAMELAQRATLECDLFIVVGSSLVVYPAAGFPELAKRLGKKLVIVNREQTPLDPIADVVVNGEIGPTLTQVVQVQ